MTDEPDTKPELLVVYMGVRCTHDGKAHAGFATLEHVQHATATGSELAPAAALAFKRTSYFDDGKDTKRLLVGGVYHTTGTLGDNGRPSTIGIARAKFQRRYDDAALVMDLELADRAARGEIAGLARLAKLRKEPELLNELRGLRRAYQGTNGAGRVAMEIAILSALRTPVRL